MKNYTALVLTAFLLSLLSAWGECASTNPGPVVAQVGAAKIRYVDLWKNSFSKPPESAPEALSPKDVSRLYNAILETLVQQEATSRNIVVSDEEVMQELSRRETIYDPTGQAEARERQVLEALSAALKQYVDDPSSADAAWEQRLKPLSFRKEDWGHAISRYGTSAEQRKFSEAIHRRAPFSPRGEGTLLRKQMLLARVLSAVTGRDFSVTDADLERELEKGTSPKNAEDEQARRELVRVILYDERIAREASAWVKQEKDKGRIKILDRRFDAVFETVATPPRFPGM